MKNRLLAFYHRFIGQMNEICRPRLIFTSQGPAATMTDRYSAVTEFADRLLVITGECSKVTYKQ